MVRCILAVMGFVAMTATAIAQTPPPADAAKDLAPTGTLRVAINLGNVVLAQKDENGQPKGITVDLARELGKRLAVPVQLVPFDAAGKTFEAVQAGAIDVLFLAIEPVRANEIAFSPPYVIIEGVYMVPKESPIASNDDVDRPGVRIGVNRGSAYDLYLTRTLKQAQLVRSANGMESLVTDKLEAAAGVKQAIVAFASTRPELRVIDGRFMEIRQAMGTPKGREAGARYLHGFIEEMKRTGFVAEAVKRHNQNVTLAPPAN